MSYLKYRPAYNCSVIGNTQAYWRYAIKATIYKIRKEKAEISKSKQAKRKAEMIHLAEIYAMESLNSYYKDRNLSDRKLDGKHTG